MLALFDHSAEWSELALQLGHVGVGPHVHAIADDLRCYAVRDAIRVDGCLTEREGRDVASRHRLVHGTTLLAELRHGATSPFGACDADGLPSRSRHGCRTAEAFRQPDAACEPGNDTENR